MARSSRSPTKGPFVAQPRSASPARSTAFREVPNRSQGVLTLDKIEPTAHLLGAQPLNLAQASATRLPVAPQRLKGRSPGGSLMRASHPVDLHDLVAVVVDDLDGDAAG